MEARKAPNVHELGDGDKIRRKNVTFHNHDSSDREDSDFDFKNEMRLSLKKQKGLSDRLQRLKRKIEGLQRQIALETSLSLHPVAQRLSCLHYKCRLRK